MEWLHAQTKVSGQGGLELALEMKRKESLRKRAFFTFLKTAGSGIHDCFHGCVGA
jgi:hypothetical protein